MKKLILLFVMCLMAAIATVQAQVEVTSNSKSGIMLLRKTVVLEVFSQISADNNLSAKKLCEDKITKGMSILFRTDLKRWEFAQKLNARNGQYQKYILTFNEESLDSTATVTNGVARAYRKSFGKFTEDLLRERRKTGYSKLVADEALSKELRKAIKELTKICMKDLERMCERKKW